MGAAVAGFALAGLPSALAPPPPENRGSSATATPAALPAADAPGADLATLPRHPASVRTAYVQEVQGSSLVTAVAYVTDAELDDVRSFYRRVFREGGWDIAELDFSLTRWLFLVSSGSDTALVSLTTEDERVVIEIELEQPQAAVPTPPGAGTPAPPPAAPPPPPALPPGDGDDDDDA